MFCTNCNRAEHGINYQYDIEEEIDNCNCRCHWRRWYVNVYEMDRSYGGPEEGGWWYTTLEPIQSVLFENLKEAETYWAYMEKKYPRNFKSGNVNYGGGDYLVCIEQRFAQYSPEETPRYE